MNQQQAQSNKNEDSALVRQAKGGDEKAYAHLMNKYKTPVYQLLLKKVRNKNDAEDLTLEAFGKAFANLHNYSDEYPFSSWLYKIAINNCIDFLRHRKGRQQTILSDSPYPESVSAMLFKSNVPDPEERMIIKQRAIILRKFINKLKPQYKELIELRYFKELSYHEIAKALDLPLGTLKVQLFRARNTLYDLISETEVND